LIRGFQEIDDWFLTGLSTVFVTNLFIANDMIKSRTFKKICIAFFGFASSSTVVLAAATQCPNEYANGIAPKIISQAKMEKVREICYSHFGVMHSGITRTPIWSAERLTSENIVAAREMKRKNAFHPESMLPDDERAELSDYARSGYDRGQRWLRLVGQDLQFFK